MLGKMAGKVSWLFIGSAIFGNNFKTACISVGPKVVTGSVYDATVSVSIKIPSLEADGRWKFDESNAQSALSLGNYQGLIWTNWTATSTMAVGSAYSNALIPETYPNYAALWTANEGDVSASISTAPGIAFTILDFHLGCARGTSYPHPPYYQQLPIACNVTFAASGPQTFAFETIPYIPVVGNCGEMGGHDFPQFSGCARMRYTDGWLFDKQQFTAVNVTARAQDGGEANTFLDEFSYFTHAA